MQCQISNAARGATMIGPSYQSSQTSHSPLALGGEPSFLLRPLQPTLHDVLEDREQLAQARALLDLWQAEVVDFVAILSISGLGAKLLDIAAVMGIRLLDCNLNILPTLLWRIFSMAIPHSGVTGREMPYTTNKSKHTHTNSPRDRIYRQTAGYAGHFV